MINLKTEWGEVKDLIPFFILNTYLNMANINKIRISGTSYDIQDKNAAKTVTLTQSEYDSLTVKDPNVFYIISDSEYTFDGYWTSAQTNSAITEAVSGKADSSSVYLKSETSGATEISTALNDKLDATAYTPTDLSNYYTTAQTNTKISQAVSGKTNQSDFSGHTANTTVHVTAQDKTNWNAKSDFSGSYNDLTDKPTIPTVPTSNTAFTNDAGYLVANDITGKTNQSDFTAHTSNASIHVTTAQTAAWDAKSNFSGSYNDLTDKLSAGTNITIVDNVISAEGGGGGKAVSGGTNISITTGETADTINCTLPIKTNAWNSLTFNTSRNPSQVLYASAFGDYTTASGKGSFAIGKDTTASGEYSFVGGYNSSQAKGSKSFSFGDGTVTNGMVSVAFGRSVTTNNECEFSCGKLNKSVSSSTTFGDSGNTLFSVGNGTSTYHNAFEVRQNGDIYITSGGTDILLQDHLGGGGGSDINVVQTTGTSTTDVMSQDAVTTQLDNKANKTAAVGGYQFGTTSNVENIKFKAVGTGYIGNPIYYPNINGKAILTNNLTWAKNNYNFQLVETSAITTSITSSSTDSQVPSAKAVNDKLGGLSIVKMTQSEYDALATKDSNTLYVIVN